MSANSKLVPSSSQTVGPFFRIGLDYLIDRAPSPEDSETISIQGRVLDRDGVPVPEALLEFWSSAEAERKSQDGAIPDSFRRAATDMDGHFSVVMKRPAAAGPNDGSLHAPHLCVLVFARGLLRHLMSRVYFDDEPKNESDPVLLAVPIERRGTLIAHVLAPNSFHWDVQLQGIAETVFFAW